MLGKLCEFPSSDVIFRWFILRLCCSNSQILWCNGLSLFPDFPKANFAEFLEVFCSELYHLRHIFIRVSLFLEPLNTFFVCAMCLCKRNVSCELNAGGCSV